MYLVPPAGAPLLFGDIFSPAWLFDAVVNRDAIQFGEVSMRGGIRGYAPLPTRQRSPVRTSSSPTVGPPRGTAGRRLRDRVVPGPKGRAWPTALCGPL